MSRFSAVAPRVRRTLALPPLLTLILALDALGYAAGMTGWYGPVLSQADTPVWAWPFIPDCPLFGLLGGLALVLVVARDWPAARRRQAQTALLAGGGVALALAFAYGFEWLPGDPAFLRNMAALWGLLGASLLLCGVCFRRPPAWLLCIIAAGQIKYGLWTITAWLLWWRNTAALYGAPLVTAESVLMTVAHVGLALQGLVLFAWFRPTVGGALAVLGWFTLSDLVDYGPAAWGLGWHPGVPAILPLRFIRNSTVIVTWLLSAGLLVAGLWPPRARAAGAAPQPRAGGRAASRTA